jgi:tRNA nucleotidyltransferase (CCA-adding enzyme)
VQTEPEPVDAATVRDRFAARGTTPVALRFTVPSVVDDQLWPQLRRSVSGVGGELDRRGFDVLRATAVADPHEPTAGADPEQGDTLGPDDRTVALLFELAVAARPTVERHEGPPIEVPGHAQSFYETYADSDAAGPFLDGDRYVVERPREFTTATGFLDSDALLDVALGSDIRRALTAGYDLLVGDEAATLANRFGRQLARYLDPTVRGR